LPNNKHNIPEKEQAQNTIDQAEQQSYYPDLPHQGMELARIYFPIQEIRSVYPPTQALKMGTLFPELYRPYPY